MHPRARRQGGRARRRDSHRHHHHRHRDVGRRRRAGDDGQGRGQGRRLCVGARLLQPADRQDDRAQPADLSGQGLFADHPDRQPPGAADHRRDRRAQSGRRLALRRPAA
ncbi:hypothetical protein, partial [Mesorhizobium sp.]|uniref:hypothetical protein n=1 Tax=Mesorhizobium sp. TaxID=1871066 RepID=UPI003457AAF9